jgi:hypothetical protein
MSTGEQVSILALQPVARGRNRCGLAASLHVSVDLVRNLAKTATKKVSKVALGDATDARWTPELPNPSKVSIVPLTDPTFSTSE